MRLMQSRRFSSPTSRLALSYLAIILTLSIGFSVIFFNTTMSYLGAKPNVPKSEVREGEQPQFFGATIDNDVPLKPIASPSDLDSQLKERVSNIRANLIRGLIGLNAGALLAGSGLSYYLARRTLRPIEAAMEVQTRFSSDASHELRTPLAALRVQNEVELANPRLTVKEARKTMRNTVRQAIRLEELADGLLRLSRGEFKQFTTKPVMLEEITNRAISQVVTRAQAKRITIQDVIEDVSVRGDVQSLAQVVTIILSNAIKYSAIGTAIRIESSRDGKYGVLHIFDNGPGIAAKDLPHIFERFYRADNARSHSKDEQGYGLGLSIAQQIVMQHDGKIAVQSELGKGAVFTIKLPLAN